MVRFLSFFLLLPFFAHAQTPFVPDERAYYGLIDRGSGRCLDIAGASTASGARGRAVGVHPRPQPAVALCARARPAASTTALRPGTAACA